MEHHQRYISGSPSLDHMKSQSLSLTTQVPVLVLALGLEVPVEGLKINSETRYMHISIISETIRQRVHCSSYPSTAFSQHPLHLNLVTCTYKTYLPIKSSLYKDSQLIFSLTDQLFSNR